jgi:hypothetical protein
MFGKRLFQVCPVEMWKLPGAGEASDVSDNTYFICFEERNEVLERMIRVAYGVNRQRM